MAWFRGGGLSQKRARMISRSRCGSLPVVFAAAAAAAVAASGERVRAWPLIALVTQSDAKQMRDHLSIRMAGCGACLAPRPGFADVQKHSNAHLHQYAGYLDIRRPVRARIGAPACTQTHTHTHQDNALLGGSGPLQIRL